MYSWWVHYVHCLQLITREMSGALWCIFNVFKRFGIDEIWLQSYHIYSVQMQNYRIYFIMTPHNGIILFIISVLYVIICRINVTWADLDYRICERYRSQFYQSYQSVIASLCPLTTKLTVIASLCPTLLNWSNSEPCKRYSWSQPTK